jgi:transposase
MRWLLVQAAWTALRCAPKHPMSVWALQVAERRGKRIAVVALARKLAGILFALWRDGTTYNPNQGAD